MKKFKVGDKVTTAKNCSSIKIGKIYEVKGGTLQLFIEEGENFCSCESDWQLVEPKQRTIEEVRVGDITVEADNKNPAEVVEVLKNIFAYLWNDSVQWITFKRAKELDWKIKQPEENKETTLDDVQSTLERIEKIEKEKSDILSKLSEITKMCL